MPCLGKIEHLELSVFWLRALLFDVVLNSLSCATIADCGDVVTIGPERSTPELLFDGGDLKTAFGSEGFYETDDLSTGVDG